MKLKDQIVIITGGSSGIGRAVALMFAGEGAAVTIVHHGDQADADKVVGEIEGHGGRARSGMADVGDEKSVEALFAEAGHAFGPATILVNSAGVDASGTHLKDMTLATWETAIRTNLTGPFLTSRAFLRALGDAKGRIINISSIHEDVPHAGGTEYCSSKGGLRMLTRTLALETAGKGVLVNGVAPGMVLTPMNQEAIDDPEVLKDQVKSIPLKRAAQPEEVAALALFLASGGADYATGTTFTLDGGLTLSSGQGA